jgi:hypothetical protein
MAQADTPELQQFIKDARDRRLQKLGESLRKALRIAGAILVPAAAILAGVWFFWPAAFYDVLGALSLLVVVGGGVLLTDGLLRKHEALGLGTAILTLALVPLIVWLQWRQEGLLALVWLVGALAVLALILLEYAIITSGWKGDLGVGIAISLVLVLGAVWILFGFRITAVAAVAVLAVGGLQAVIMHDRLAELARAVMVMVLLGSLGAFGYYLFSLARFLTTIAGHTSGEMLSAALTRGGIIAVGVICFSVLLVSATIAGTAFLLRIALANVSSRRVPPHEAERHDDSSALSRVEMAIRSAAMRVGLPGYLVDETMSRVMEVIRRYDFDYRAILAEVRSVLYSQVPQSVADDAVREIEREIHPSIFTRRR